MNQNLIVKHNDLIEAGYKLTLEEQRLVLACISKIDSRPGAEVPDAITITASEYAGLFGVRMKHAYSQLKEATNNLYEQDILIKGEQKTRRMRWVSSVLYNDGEGSVTLDFSQRIKPYLSQLNGMFTRYQLVSVAQLKSPYSIRLYELLSQWRDKGKREIRVSELRSLLELEDRYEKFYELKRWVIQPAVNELNRQTDFDVTFETQREGRFIKRLLFSFVVEEPSLLDI
ncbi:replication initiation protein [Endozoicomonas sp. ISHI1]|uniref:replication initiation protein n=1 Tax=Endozoicomonas sp. ISHI1 TaxID=2825882 RepID=UPI002148BB46|nr:replication initiation protein [Endozoicomonas sp. ISHI1]